MRKSTMMKAVAGAVILGCVGLAGAQTNGPAGISARIGGFFPTNDLARNIGKTWFGFGADYKLDRFNVGSVNETNPAYLSISADYYEKDNLRAIPVAINYNLRADQFVFSGGVGVDFDRVFGDSKTGFSGQLAATYEFSKSGTTNNTPLFIQAKYFFANKTELSGFGVYLGARF